MYSKLIALALCSASVAGAQVRTKAIELANKTVSTANARTEALGNEQKSAVADRKIVSLDSSKKVASGAVAATMSSGSDLPAMTREVFQYDGGGRRDPFTSLTRTGALRPHVSELTLVLSMVQTNGGRSVATVRDNTTKELYVVKVGDSLGRYRVVQIDKRAVTFAIEEFGFSRQEKLTMSDSTIARNQ